MLPFEPRDQYHLKPTSIVLVAQNKKSLHGFCCCFLHIQTHTGREIIDIGTWMDIDVLLIYLSRKRGKLTLRSCSRDCGAGQCETAGQVSLPGQVDVESRVQELERRRHFYVVV